VIGRLASTIGGLWVLATLGLATRLRFRGRYWRWRMQTALPAGTSPTGRFEKLRLGLEYGRWAWRMRRLR